MLNFVENLLENERDPRSGPMNDQDHSLSLSFSNKFSTKFSIVSYSLKTWRDLETQQERKKGICIRFEWRDTI
jgi:hypothetical protein